MIKEKVCRGLKLHRGQQKIVSDILSSDAMYYTICTPRQFGKSTMAIQLMLYYAINNKNVKVLFSSPSYAQCSKVFRELMKGIGNSGIVKVINRQENSIILINNSEIYFKSIQIPDNLRGYDIDYMFCDEAALYKDDTFNMILRPMLKVKGKKCFLLSTPKGKNYFYKMFQLGKTDNERYRCYVGSSNDNPMENKLETEDAKKTLPDNIFRQEYMGEFVDGGVVFPSLKDAAKIEKWVEPVEGMKYYVGIDIAMSGDFLVMTVMNKVGEVVYSYRDNNKTMEYMLNQMKIIFNKYNPKCSFVETNGIGNSIYEYIAKLHKSVKPFVTTNDTKKDIIEDVIYDLQTNKIFIPTEQFYPYYYDEMIDFGFDYSPKTRKVIYAAISGHDDCVMSLAFANHARHSGFNTGSYYIEKI